MTPATTNKKTTLDDHAELGFGALLVAEAEDGSYEPVSMVSTLSEARSMAGENFRNRMISVANGKSPMCPDRYVVWTRGFDSYKIISTFELR